MRSYHPRCPDMHLWQLIPWVWAGFSLGEGAVADFACDVVQQTQAVWKGEVRQAECEAMSTAFLRELNRIRRKRGLPRLRRDEALELRLTVPHNEWQRRRGDISHGRGAMSLSRRSHRAGFGNCALGECVASSSYDAPNFVSQYRGSPPHWEILMDRNFRFIAVSTLYDPESDTYYSAVNLR
jgi:uncharacterized protein YkwD